MTSTNIIIGSMGKTLNIADRLDGTVTFDITGQQDDTIVCVDLTEAQARQIVERLIARWPSLSELQYVVPIFEARTTRPVTFMGMDLAAGPDSFVTFVCEDAQPEPKISPNGMSLHDPVFDSNWDVCGDGCYAARASQRLYGDPSHAVSEAQVAKQRERDAQGLDTPKWDGIDHSWYCSTDGNKPVEDCTYFRFGRFPGEPHESL